MLGYAIEDLELGESGGWDYEEGRSVVWYAKEYYWWSED